MYEQAKQRRTTLPKEGREEQARARDREQKKVGTPSKRSGGGKVGAVFWKEEGSLMNRKSRHGQSFRKKVEKNKRERAIQNAKKQAQLKALKRERLNALKDGRNK